MSISALTSLAATRNTAQPTKQSVGKAAAGAPGAQRKSAHRRFPLLEIVGATVAATGWAFVLPGSPLVPYIHGQTSRTIVPLLVAFGATSLIGLTASGLQGERRPQRQGRPAGSK